MPQLSMVCLVLKCGAAVLAAGAFGLGCCEV